MRLRSHLFMVAATISCVICLYSASALNALVRVDINRGQVDPLPIALVNFQGKIPEEADLGNLINGVISNDLQNSGIFRMIDHHAFLENLSFDTKPRFENWRRINSVLVVQGDVQIHKTTGMVHVHIKTWDPYSEIETEHVIFKTASKSWRRIAHKIADNVYRQITGEKGYFDTRILFVSEEGAQRHLKKRLVVMDQDGANIKFLTPKQDYILSPRFDHSGNRAVYMSYKNRVPQVFSIDLINGSIKLIWQMAGMSFAPRFSPDGAHIIMSVAKDGTTAIYEINVANGQSRKIISDIGSISTSPSYSPDGKQIVFNSDRSGSRQLYIMNKDGSDVKRISFGSGVYATPVWSPRGDFIAFTKIEGNQFFIGVMRSDGTGERLLTTSWLEEGPTWSPNGRVIMFYRQANPGGMKKIYAIDVTGYNEREIRTPFPSLDPAWSPLLE